MNGGLRGRAERGGGRGGPWEADARVRKGRARKQEEAGRGRCQAHSGWQTPSSRRRTTIITGWIIIRLSHCWFSTAAQTNHYTSSPTASCGSQVSPNARQEAGEAS